MTDKKAKSFRLRSNLSTIMGRERLRIADVSRLTGIHRNMLTLLYYDRARKVALEEIAKLCAQLGCRVGELLELVEEPVAETSTRTRSTKRR